MQETSNFTATIPSINDLRTEIKKIFAREGSFFDVHGIETAFDNFEYSLKKKVRDYEINSREKFLDYKDMIECEVSDITAEECMQDIKLDNELLCNFILAISKYPKGER